MRSRGGQGKHIIKHIRKDSERREKNKRFFNACNADAKATSSVKYNNIYLSSHELQERDQKIETRKAGNDEITRQALC